MRRLRLAAVLAVLIVGAACLAYAMRQKAVEKAKEKQPQRPTAAIPVEAAPIVVGTIRDARALFGTLYARTQFVAAAKVTGRLTSLTADIGDAVDRNQIVAQIDDEELREDVLAAQSALAVRRAELAEAVSNVEYAGREYERSRELSSRSIASESDIDAKRLLLQTNEARVAVTEAEVAQAESALRAAEVRRSYTEVRAAWSEGDSRRVVGERFANEGDLLAVNDPIVSVLDIDQVMAVVFVTEKDYPRLSLGQSAVVKADSFPDREWIGEVSRLAPVFRASSRQARVEVRVPNEDWTLKPGMFVRVEVLLEERPNAKIISRDALAKRRDAQGVFVVSDDGATVRFVPVKTGVVEGNRVELLEPADLDGMIVTLGQNLLEDGSAIIVAGQAEEPAQAAVGAEAASAGGKP
jgi:RND family efflux transporter MFP subunit